MPSPPDSPRTTPGLVARAVERVEDALERIEVEYRELAPVVDRWGGGAWSAGWPMTIGASCTAGSYASALARSASSLKSSVVPPALVCRPARKI